MEKNVFWRYLRPASLVALTLLLTLSACRPEFEDDPPIQLPGTLKAYPGRMGSNGRWHYRIGVYKQAFRSSVNGPLSLKSDVFRCSGPSLVQEYPLVVSDSAGYHVFDFEAYDGQYWMEIWVGSFKAELDNNSPYYGSSSYQFFLKSGLLYQIGESDPTYVPTGTSTLDGFAYHSLNGNNIELSFNAAEAFPSQVPTNTFVVIRDSINNINVIDMSWVASSGWVSAIIDKSVYGGNKLEARFGTWNSLYTRQYYGNFFPLP